MIESKCAKNEFNDAYSFFQFGIDTTLVSKILDLFVELITQNIKYYSLSVIIKLVLPKKPFNSY